MGTTKCTSQLVMLGLGVVFWGAAAGFMYIGAWVIQSYGEFHKANDVLKQTYTTVPAIISICIGVVMFIVGIMSCCSAFQRNRCLLASFFICLLIITTFLIAAGVLGYVYKTEVETSVKDQMNKTLTKYNGTDTAIDTEIDWLQEKFSCCGVKNSSDWAGFPWGKDHAGVVPRSCCNTTAFNCSTDAPIPPAQAYNQGCYSFARETFENNLKYIALSTTAMAVIMIVGMISACVLFWQKRDSLPYANLTESGYTV